MDGNPFGHSITYRDGGSVKLLDYSEDKKIVLRDDALDILRRIQEPVAIISLGNVGLNRVVNRTEELKIPRVGWANGGSTGKSDEFGIHQQMLALFHLKAYYGATVHLRARLITRRSNLYNNATVIRKLTTISNQRFRSANNLGDKFSDFSVYGLPHPGLSSHQLRELHEIDTSEFDEEFIEEVTYAVNEILNTVQPKYIDSNPVNGDVLATFLECCVQTLNAGDNQFDLSLSTNYDSIVQFAARRAATEALDWYRSMMVAELNESVLPVPWTVFNNVHEESLHNAENCFNNSLVGNGIHLLKAYQEFRRDVDTFLTKLRGQNSELLYSCNRETAVLLWDQLVTSHLTADDLFISVEVLEQAIDRFEEQYLDARLDCPEASRVLDEFKSIYYNAARRLFNDLKTFREVAEVEKLLTIEAQKDRATAQAELPKIAGRMEGFDEISRRQKEEADRYRQQVEDMGRKVAELEQQMQRREGEYKAMINNLQNELRNR
ncbi:4871_t:CDS:2 [Paraglomus occultum]|uniref:4871_t:CDS:1 n=1 Tax=Paraglomus occultum TaxID=144539 RepID=A0A9N8ZQQ8_9GLOM|nr:4871_t:CDS:2 [Paraglomus occultum]